METVEFYFDFLSPFSYLAFFRLNQLQQEYPMSIVFRPVVLGILLNHYGIKGPGEIPAKRNALFRSLLEEVLHREIPFDTPEKLPFDSTPILRMAEAAKDLADEVSESEVMEALWSYGWQRGHNYESSDALITFLQRRNLPALKLMELSQSRKISLRLKENLQSAFTRGIFGVPSFFIKDRFFWGNDSFNSFENFLYGRSTFILDEELNKYLKKHNFVE